MKNKKEVEHFAREAGLQARNNAYAKSDLQFYIEQTKMKEQFKKKIDRVRFIEGRYPEVKGNKALLVQRYLWYFCDVDWYIDFEKLEKIPSPHSIVRAQQRLHEKARKEGDELETEETIKKRAIAEVIMHKMMKEGST